MHTGAFMAKECGCVVISGIHSGPDPSPGVGIAKSLRERFPEMRIVGKDYSLRSSGIHADVFDEIVVMPRWSEMDLSAHEALIRRDLLNRNAVYISGLDAEIDWLSSLDAPVERCLIPTAGVLAQTQKMPSIAAAALLGMKNPESVRATEGMVAIHRLARRHGWKVWAKGRFHEAYPAESYRELILRIEQMRSSWPIEHVFVQSHVYGVENSYAFSAFEGRLLGVAAIEKRVQTEKGKTWSATVSKVEAEVARQVADFVSVLGWTGGGEIEFVRDPAGVDWLIDINPRFPAYIHGVTLCGLNLPGLLIQAFNGQERAGEAEFGGQFSRLVSEVLVRPGHEVPPMLNSALEFQTSGKHPSHQPMLVRKRKRGSQPGRDDDSGRTLRPAVLGRTAGAPVRVRNAENARFRDAMHILDSIVSDAPDGLAIVPALSVKTDPQPVLALEYLKRGWYAEVISEAEARWAVGNGFVDEKLILNGPSAAAIAKARDYSFCCCFADSIEAFSVLVSEGRSKLCGVRIRPSRIRSRFGVDLSDYSSHGKLLELVEWHRAKGGAIAFHMHVPADVIGPRAWLDCFHEMVVWVENFKMETGVNVELIDIGGGWHAEELGDVFRPLLFDEVVPRVVEIGGISRLIMEPGKAVSSSLSSLESTIVEIRRCPEGESFDVILNCSIADLPMTQFYAHEIEHCRDAKSFGLLGGGSVRLLGNICMESDILATGVAFGTAPRVGDVLIFHGAGGYNSSMSWPFAGGVSRD